MREPLRTFQSTIVYPPEPLWCGGPVVLRVRARSVAEAEAAVAQLTSENGKPPLGRWRTDERATPFEEVA